MKLYLPLMLAPAIIPVTPENRTPKTTAKFTSSPPEEV